jgi:hypothetical protein
MKAAKDIVTLAQELKDRAERKKDLIVDDRQITVLTTPGEKANETEVLLREPAVGDVLGQTIATLAPQRMFTTQLGQHLGVRTDLLDRLRAEHPVQHDQLVNGLLDRMHIEKKDKQKHMVRTYADPDGGVGVARALLGEGYRRIDNEDIAEAALPVILNEIPTAVVDTCELTDTKMYIKVLVPGMQISLKELVEPGHHKFLDPNSPDYVQAGFVLKNSEVGGGALSIEHMLFRLVCLNGLIRGKALSRRHVGRRNVEVAEDYTIYSTETVEADDKALMMKVQDAVRHTVNEEKFREIAQQFASTVATVEIEQPIERMQVLAPKIGLTLGEGQSVLEKLLAGGNKTQFGLINAITATAQTVESYDRSVELEEIGAQVMDLSGAEWGALVTA